MREHQLSIAQKVFNDVLIDAEDTIIYIQDFQELAAKIKELHSSFSLHTRHAIAVKSNPLAAVLSHANELGCLAEAASIQEVKLALSSGFNENQIVFDSPVKTRKEIDWCVSNLHGAVLNLNSLEELSRYPIDVPFRLGLRILLNQTTTSHSSLNVSGERSKFGIPIDNYEKIVEAIQEHQSITDLHLHQGSQFSKIENQVDGVRKVVDLAISINQNVGSKRIKRINIGGGYPVNYEGEYVSVNLYVKHLLEKCPELFDGTFDVITEFGRYTNASAGLLLAKIEYVRKVENYQLLLTHAGADVLLRSCYQPGSWNHQLIILSAQGEPKESRVLQTDVAGPLCFGGDFPFKHVNLPEAQEQDWLVIHDAGANTLGLWSKHCSRSFPKLIGFNGASFFTIKEKESDESVISFWS